MIVTYITFWGYNLHVLYTMILYRVKKANVGALFFSSHSFPFALAEVVINKTGVVLVLSLF